MRIERFVTTFGCATLLSSALPAAGSAPNLDRLEGAEGSEGVDGKAGAAATTAAAAGDRLLAKLLTQVRTGIPPELAGKEAMSFGSISHRS
jgi:hypothetical protein